MNSKAINEFGLSEQAMGEICDIFAGHARVKKVLVYGSRAMGRFHSGSDIDLTMFGDDLTFSDVARIKGELEDSFIPYMVDLSVYDRLNHAKLKDHINRVGKVFYDRFAGWQSVKLGEIANVIAGQSPKSEHYNKEGIGMPFYQGKKDFGAIYLNPPTVWTTKITKRAYKNDILMSVRAPVGALNMATEEVCIGRGLAAIRVANDNVNNEYLWYQLSKISSRLEGSTGAIFDSINRDKIADVDLEFPPLKQQRRIVAKLDAAFSEIDAAIAAAEQKVVQIENLKASMLADAFTPQSKEWQTVKLGDICEIANGGTPRSNIPEYWGGNIQWLTPKNMGEHKGIFIEGTHRQITDKGLKGSSAKLIPANSVILSSRAPIGHVLINAVEMSFNQGCRGLVPDDSVITEYLYYFIFSSKKLLNDLGTGTTFKELSAKNLANVEICLPPLEGQQAIVAKLDAAFTEIESASRATRRKISELKALKNALLNQELKGQST